MSFIFPDRTPCCMDPRVLANCVIPWAGVSKMLHDVFFVRGKRTLATQTRSRLWRRRLLRAFSQDGFWTPLLSARLGRPSQFGMSLRIPSLLRRSPGSVLSGPIDQHSHLQFGSMPKCLSLFGLHHQQSLCATPSVLGWLLPGRDSAQQDASLHRGAGEGQH